MDCQHNYQRFYLFFTICKYHRAQNVVHRCFVIKSWHKVDLREISFSWWFLRHAMKQARPSNLLPPHSSSSMCWDGASGSWNAFAWPEMPPIKPCAALNRLIGEFPSVKMVDLIPRLWSNLTCEWEMGLLSYTCQGVIFGYQSHYSGKIIRYTYN